MRRARRGDAFDAAIAYAKEHSRRLVRARGLPNLRHAQHAEARVSIALQTHRRAQQPSVAFGFGLSIPFNACDVTFRSPAIVGAARVRIVNELHEVTPATW